MLREVVAVFLLAFVAIGISTCVREKAGTGTRNCRWESRYPNTLQHDIHREWVCDGE
jgi:hypothetical protein